MSLRKRPRDYNKRTDIGTITYWITIFIKYNI